MSEQNSPAPSATGDPGVQSPPKAPIAEVPQEVANSIAAAARREAEAKLAEANTRLAALEAKQKEREEAALAEQNKWQELAEKRQQEIAELVPFREKWTSWEAAEAARVEENMADLTDKQKEIVSALPLALRMPAISEYQAAADNRPSPPGGRGNTRANHDTEIKTKADLEREMNKYRSEKGNTSSGRSPL